MEAMDTQKMQWAQAQWLAMEGMDHKQNGNGFRFMAGMERHGSTAKWHMGSGLNGLGMEGNGSQQNGQWVPGSMAGMEGHGIHSQPSMLCLL